MDTVENGSKYRSGKYTYIKILYMLVDIDGSSRVGMIVIYAGMVLYYCEFMCVLKENVGALGKCIIIQMMQ